LAYSSRERWLAVYCKQSQDGELTRFSVTESFPLEEGLCIDGWMIYGGNDLQKDV
jgi:hypothetical protein